MSEQIRYSKFHTLPPYFTDIIYFCLTASFSVLSHLPFLLFYRKGRLGQLHGTCNMQCYCTTVTHSTMVVIDRAVSIFDFKGFLDYGLTF